MESTVAGIYSIRNVAERWEWAVVLRRGEDLILQSRVTRTEVDREGVGFPGFQQTHARGTLVTQFQQVVAAQFVLNAGVEVQNVRIAKILVPPLNVTSA